MAIDAENVDGASKCRCVELEETIRKADVKIVELELEIGKRNNENDALEAKNKKLEDERTVLECELSSLFSKYCEVKRQLGRTENKMKADVVVDLVEDEDKFCLMVENKTLEGEKKKAESDAEIWKGMVDVKVSPRVTVPSTPAVKTAFDVINICDSDDEDEISDSKMCAPDDQLIRMNRVSSASGKKIDSGNTITESLSEQDQLEEADDEKDKIPRTATSTRKRAVNIVNSDSDSDDEDNVPLSKLKRMNSQESCSNLKRSADIQGVKTRSKRRLFTAKECEEKVRAKRSCSNQTSENEIQRGISTIDDVEDTESEEDESGSKEESSNSFIDDRSDPGANDSDDNASTESGNEADSNIEVDSGDNASAGDEDEVDMNVELSEIVLKLRRSKGNKEWEFHGDMLKAFAQDPEVCMKAVCALYRRQTADEKAIKKALVCNNRGFSKFDAKRGCLMAEFLTDGDPDGDVTKTVQELQKYYSNGVKVCRKLAKRYSQQLFEIYTNHEDPFFNPDELGHK